MKARIARSHLIIYTYMLAALWLAGCENQIPYNPGEQKPLLIMNALLDAGKADNYVYLHLSQGNKIRQVNRSTLSLYVNGQLAEKPQPLEDSQPVRSTFCLHTAFRPGDRIRLEATAEGEEYRVEAEVTVPQPVKDIRVDTCTTKIIIRGRMENYRRILVTLRDLPDEKNYYRLEVLNNYRIQAQNPIPVPVEDEFGIRYVYEDTIFYYTDRELINREDIILTDGHVSYSDKDEENQLFPSIKNKYNVFTDNQFSNSTATLKVYTACKVDYLGFSAMRPSLLSIVVRLFSLGREEYFYLKGLSTIDDDEYDTTLMGPVGLPSNVKGGLGFVGVSSEVNVTM